MSESADYTREERLAWDMYFAAQMLTPDGVLYAEAYEAANRMLKLRRQRFAVDRAPQDLDELKALEDK